MVWLLDGKKVCGYV